MHCFTSMGRGATFLNQRGEISTGECYQVLIQISTGECYQVSKGDCLPNIERVCVWQGECHENLGRGVL